MPDSSDSAASLLLFSGVDYRERDVNCPQCRWSGKGGMLRVPRSSRDNAEIVYTCPRCDAPVARHSGLSDAEILIELERISQLLADELADTRRARIEEQLVEPVEEGRSATPEPANAELDVDSEAATQPRLDYRAIRARLGSAE